MNSKIETSTRVCLLGLMLVLASACTGGRSALSKQPLGASSSSSSSSSSSNLAACGSMTKPCDPNNLGGQTCSSLGAGSGTLMCDPVTCSYDRSMCTGTGQQGGGGLGALLGLFGRGAGGRPAMGMGMNMGMRGGAGGRAGGNAEARGGAGGARESSEMGGAGGEKAEGGNGGGGAGGSGSSEEKSDGGMAAGGAGGAGGAAAESGGAGGAEAGAGGEGGGPAMMAPESPDMPQ